MDSPIHSTLSESNESGSDINLGDVMSPSPLHHLGIARRIRQNFTSKSEGDGKEKEPFQTKNDKEDLSQERGEYRYQLSSSETEEGQEEATTIPQTPLRLRSLSQKKRERTMSSTTRFPLTSSLDEVDMLFEREIFSEIN
tara:strand:+ start:752 stop:1171 length:420 start_codon:yes stop_codon:yes gene_type:complete